MIADALFMVVNMAVVALLAPLFEGLIRKLAARLQGRYGPPIVQPYRDLAKLFKRILATKPQTVSDSLYVLAPILVFAATLAAAALVPTFASRPLTISDIIVIFYLMAMVRFITSIASFNVANPFAVIGVAREHLLTLGVEPAALLAATIAALIAGTSSAAGVSVNIQQALASYHWSFIPALLGFAAALLADLALPPFDVAEAEQEISEGLLAEYSGPLLGLMKWSINCKRLVLLNLLFALFIPYGIASTYTIQALLLGIIAYFAKVLIASVLLSLLVAAAARLKIHDVVNYLIYSFAFSLIAGIAYLMGG